ncbi:MAG: class I SAM-dependent methyltransferase [Candidatus Krumholzibacteria bacterium]
MRTFTRIKQKLIRTFPFLGGVQRYLYRFKPYPAKFRAYYLDGGWNNPETTSGPGSTLDATRVVRQHLPGLFDKFHIRTVVDIPCGDFNWMSEVDLGGVLYEGYDIVPELVEANRSQYSADNIKFGRRDLMKDSLPRADLIICRDCLLHYPNSHVHRAVRNMKESGSRYLLTTTFTNLETNSDLEAIGHFRPANLERAPFNFPAPLMVIDEGEGNGKSLALWSLEEIAV